MAIIVLIKSGLGNQLFQYAAGKSMALRLNTELLLDNRSFVNDTYRSYGLDKLNISVQIISRRRSHWEAQLRRKTYRPLRWLLQGAGSPWVSTHIRDFNAGYDARLARPYRNVYLDGYWQSELYFAGIRDVLLKEFTFKDEPDDANREMQARICGANAVCVHIRRGDYVTGVHGQTRLGTCPMDYYQTAMAWLQARLTDLEFFVFSDDPEWVATHFPRTGRTTLVTHNVGRQDAEDLRLMMNCRHFIIANSTFSWWAAWLGQAAGKIVIAPRCWNASRQIPDKDRVPESWLRM